LPHAIVSHLVATMSDCGATIRPNSQSAASRQMAGPGKIAERL
jgi:hypothetical protein